jgi:hypothetical protein
MPAIVTVPRAHTLRRRRTRICATCGMPGVALERTAIALAVRCELPDAAFLAS